MIYGKTMKRYSQLLFALALCISSGAISPIAASASTNSQTFTIKTSSAFSPSQITVHAGRTVELQFVGTGGVHGVASSELGIPDTMITPNGTKSVSFTPAKPGTYVLHCTIVCGPDHKDMALVIHVVS